MGRTLKDDMRQDAIHTFLNEDEFAEVVTYRPNEGRPRQIRAHVNRNPPAPVEGALNAICPKAIVTVANDQIYGIGAIEVDRGVDKIDLALKEGGTIESRTLGDVIYQDHAFLKLEVR